MCDSLKSRITKKHCYFITRKGKKPQCYEKVDLKKTKSGPCFSGV